MKTLSLVAFVVALSVVASLPTGTAQQPPNRKEFADQAQETQHAHEEFKRVDAELAKAFDKALADEASPQLREALIASQRAWASYRDADAHYESLFGEGGSMRNQSVSERMTYLTRLRIYQLQTPFVAGWHELPSTPK